MAETTFAEIADRFAATGSPIVSVVRRPGIYEATRRIGSHQSRALFDADGRVIEFFPGHWQEFPRGSKVTGLAAAALAHPGEAA